MKSIAEHGMTDEVAQEILEGVGSGCDPMTTVMRWACLAGLRSGLEHPLHIESWAKNGATAEAWFHNDGNAEFIVEPSEPFVFPIKLRISDQHAAGMLEATITAVLVGENYHLDIEAGWTPAEGVA